MGKLIEPEFRDGELVRRGPYPEFTTVAVLVGWFLGTLIALSIGYASLKLGFSIEGSELAAILGWGILRGMMRRTSIVENNINQTIASAVNGASSGIMFCLPALFILSREEGLASVANFEPWLMVFAGITGAFIGLAFVIPLRKQMIDFDRLPYPGGIAVATILKSPGAGIRKAVLLLSGAAISAAVYLTLILTLGEDPAWEAGKTLQLPFMLNVTFFLSLMTVGVGFLSGKGGFWFGVGGFICYWLLAPLLTFFGSDDARQIADPPVRQAVVSVADTRALQDVADVIQVFDAPSAQRVTALIGELKSRSSAGNDVDPLPLTQSINRSHAETLLATIAALEAQAANHPEWSESINDRHVDRDKLNSMAKRLRDRHRPESAIDAARAMVELKKKAPDQFERLSQTILARELPSALQQCSTLQPGERNAVLTYAQYDENYHDVPGALNKKLFKPTGIGMLIGAALGGIFMAFPLVFSALRSLRDARKSRSSAADASRDEMPLGLLIAAVTIGLIVLIVLGWTSVPDMELWRAGLMAILGTLWVWIAGVIVAECVGRTNWSPLSGMTLIAVTILILITSGGLEKPDAIISSVLVGAAICLAISQASDMMLDLKSGYLVGAIPRRQQIAQFVGAWLGPIVIVWLLVVLSKTYTLGGDDLPAPQGEALASMIRGLVEDNAPIHRYAAGGILGLMLSISGLGGIGVMVALGFYMPFHIVLTYTVGCLIRLAVDRFWGRTTSEDIGIPFAAGLIVGEALVGVGFALYRVGYGWWVS